MIDLHCHLVPGIDDGARDLDEALSMARLAVADGIQAIACTPHIYPGLYDNDGPDIHRRVGELQAALDEQEIALQLVAGADVQLAADMVGGLRSGHIPSLNKSRYFLFEPPHHVAPARMPDMIFDLQAAGYVPIITHPERLTWIEDGYDVIRDAFEGGAWIQLTAGAITGMFGRRAQYWAERMLEEGRVHLVSTDAHNMRRRRPILSEAREAVARRLGPQAADDMVLTRPAGVLVDRPPEDMPALIGAAPKGAPRSAWRGLFGGQKTL